MILYHFCAERHVRKILRQGIAIGGVMEPTDSGFLVHSGWMWLTLDPDPKQQSWTTNYTITYSRTAWRLTVEIPKDSEDRIFDREKIVQLYPNADCLFKRWAGSENWRVYHGIIPKEWIVAADRQEPYA